MSVLVGLGGLLVIMFGGVAVLLVRRLTGPTLADAARAGDRSPLVVRAYRRARVRALGCLGGAVLVLVAAVLLDRTRPDLLGLPLALSPGLAAAAALLGYAALPAAADPGAGSVTASLTRRTAWSFGSRRAFALPAALAAGYLAFLGWAAVVAGPDDQGRSRAITVTNGLPELGDGALSSTASPFPGSFYGAPLAAVTVLLALATYLALRRIATTPTLPVAGLGPADRDWRAVSTQVVTRLAAAALLTYFGATMAFAGITLRSATSSLVANGGPDRGVVGGTWLAVLGATAALGGTVVALTAVVRAASLRPTPTGVTVSPAAAPRP